MTDTSRTMVDDFVAALRVAQVARVAAVQVAADLLARWAEPHRHYHTVTHLIATLEAAHRLLDTSSPDVELAVWFHDAVYDGRPDDDEEASARLAERALRELGLPAARVVEVARLVRLTATHDPAPDDAAGRLLRDADLSVLGADPATYRAYTRAVRREYAAVPEAEFRAGRAAVLRRLVDDPGVFRTPRARELWEAAAQANVAAELARLADPLIPLTGDGAE